jgi:asparagine synthase (glutamine-hydrolysing)
VSKLCGIAQLDPHPVSPSDDAFVHAAIQAPGYFAPSVHRTAGAVFGWASGCDFSQGSGISQSRDGSVCSCDGRLDNRTHLLRHTQLPSGSADSSILLHLCQQRGIAGLRDAIGDWSLCLWDAQRRTLILASDYAGIRPLYYRHTGDTVYWASTLGDLLRWTGASDLDDSWAAGFVAGSVPPERTPYIGISCVPPGHAVSISRDAVDVRPFWSVAEILLVRYPDPRDYEEQLNELFQEAVRERLGATSPNCAELSGGLDSSSVVCMADRLGKEARSEVRRLCTFSYSFDRCPDEEFFLEVERACEVNAFRLHLRDCPPLDAVQPATGEPAWWTPRFREIARRMSELGSGVLLSGQFGDLIMGNTNDDSSQVTGWFARGRFLRGVREAYDWARGLQTPVYPILWRCAGEAFSAWQPAAPSRTDWRVVPPELRRRFAAVESALLSRSLQTPEPLQHLSFTHPFAHRPLVEFMLGIPQDLVCRPGEPRRLMRRAFADLLTPRVLQRRSKAAYTGIYLDALKPLAGAMHKHPAAIQVVQRGLADLPTLLTRLERLHQGIEDEPTLRNLILLEYWLRGRFAAPRKAAA